MIYFDNNATTPIATEVFEAMKPFLTSFYGNSSSAYAFSRTTKEAISRSRESVARRKFAE
jgi:cysteine desulfurase